MGSAAARGKSSLSVLPRAPWISWKRRDALCSLSPSPSVRLLLLQGPRTHPTRAVVRWSVHYQTLRTHIVEPRGAGAYGSVRDVRHPNAALDPRPTPPLSPPTPLATKSQSRPDLGSSAEHGYFVVALGSPRAGTSCTAALGPQCRAGGRRAVPGSGRRRSHVRWHARRESYYIRRPPLVLLQQRGGELDVCMAASRPGG